MSSKQGDSGSRKRKYAQLEIARPVYTEKDFQKGYTHNVKDTSALHKLKKRAKRIEVTPRSLLNFLCRLLPILKWLPNYNLRNNIIGDTIAGITIAIMRVPQEMAYSILATLPAVSGLYVAFFSVLTYVILGTSRHISIGAMAVICIMTSDAIDSIVGEEINNKQISSPAPDNDYDDTEIRIQVAISLCLLVGIIQVGMGIFRLGIVTIYLSEPLIKGFTTGAAIHVFTSQFPKLFGVKIARRTGPIALVYTYIEFFTELPTANTCAIIISILSLLTLCVIGEINDRQAAKGWCRKEGAKGKRLPLPSELLVVIIATLASGFGGFEEKYDLGVIGDISTGLPVPLVPPLKYFRSLIGSAFAIAVVGFAISISMAKLYARKHNYEVDPNQEFIAYGGSNIVGSFFQCFPSTTSMSRTAVQEAAGGQTQLASIFAAVVVLAIILWLGPRLSQLPDCVLASTIVISLRGMLRQFTDLPILWKVSLIDFLLWFVTFSLVVLLGVDMGLLIGVVFALITIVVRSQSPYCALMGRVPDTDIYRDISFVQGVKELAGIKIFRCSSSLSFVNAEHFMNSLFKKTAVNPQRILIAREERKGKKKSKVPSPKPSNLNGSKVDTDELAMEQLVENTEQPTTPPSSSSSPSRLHTVIIECSMFNYVDVVGVKTLQAIVADYDKIGVDVIFANCKAAVRKALLTSSTLNKKQEIGLDRMYISLHDAVLSHTGGARLRTGTYLEQYQRSISTNTNEGHKEFNLEGNTPRSQGGIEEDDTDGNDDGDFNKLPENVEDSQQGNKSFTYTPDIHSETKIDMIVTH